MRANTISALLVVMFLAPCHLQAAQSQVGRVENRARTELARGWFIQSSARVTARGDEISTRIPRIPRPGRGLRLTFRIP